VVKRVDAPQRSTIARSNLAFSIDEELIYEAFYADFGPLNLGQLWRFARKLEAYLKAAQKDKKRVYLYTYSRGDTKANSCVLVGAYLILYRNFSVQDAYKLFVGHAPFLPYRDASCGISTFNLTVLDCLKGVYRAKVTGLIDHHLGEECKFNVDEYEFYEQVENGDMNWIVPGKFLAFSGPTSKREPCYGFYTKIPEDYSEYFTSNDVKAVIRLNNKMYDRKRFTKVGIQHFELYFPDGSCPPDTIRKKFLEITENIRGAVAVHCKAGLGRTGVLIACYMMKHFGFSAREAISWIRICRPGSIIGPQQHYLCEVEMQMKQEGNDYRARKDMKVQSPLRAASIDDISETENSPKGVLKSPRKALSETKAAGYKTSPTKVKSSVSKTLDMSPVLQVLPRSPLQGIGSGKGSPKSPSQRHVALNGQPRKIKMSST